MVTLQWASVERGDSAARGAPKRASHALPSPPSSPFPTFVSIRGSIISPFVLFVVSSSSMDGRAQARQPRTTFSSLLPNLYYPMFIDTHFDGLKLFKPEVFSDSRGTFSEIWKREELREWGLFFEVIQENESVSRRGVMRGLHFQAAPFGQSKLIRVPHGRVFDVVVDLRRSSSSFGKHFSVELSSENHLQLFVPRGFAHGFAVLSDEAVFSYKVDSPWTPNAERCIRLDDPAIAIEWPIPPGERILSEKDSRGISLQEWIQGNEEAE